MVESLSAASKVKMTVDEFSKVVANRRDLYEACVRNGYYLPKIKTTIITEEYILPEVHRSQDAACPRPHVVAGCG